MKSHSLKNPSTLIELLFGVVKYDYYLLHCYRVANKAADSLAKMGRLQEERFVYFVTTPPPPRAPFIFDVLASDSSISNPPVTNSRISAV